MNREPQDAPPERRDRTVGDGTEPGEQLLRDLRRRGGRRLEPGEPRDPGESGAVQLECGTREIGALDLGHLERAARVVIVLRVQPHDATGARAARATGALGTAGAADRLDLQRRQAGPRRVARDPREPAVDHRDDALDRHRGLGNVGREDHLALLRRPHRAVLLVGGEVAVKGQDREVEYRGDLGEVLGDPADLAGAGEEHQDVAVELVLREPAYRGRDLLAELAIVGLLRVLDRDGERAAFRADDRRIAEELRDRLGVERRRHHERDQLGPARPQPLDQREREVAIEVTLVELVDHDAADAAQLGMGEQPAGQHALGHELDPGRRRDLAIEPHLVADLAPEVAATLARHAGRRESRRESPRLQHDELAGDEARVEQRARDARRLAGTGRRHEHGAPPRAHRLHECRQHVVDR